MSQIEESPLSHEDASINYATEMYGRLRCEDGWREDVWTRLFQEYDRFTDTARGGDFKAQSMWNYMRLVDATDRYLYEGGPRNFTPLFYMKICEGFAIIERQARPSQFSEPDQESAMLAIEGMEHIVRWWRAHERARE